MGDLQQAVSAVFAIGELELWQVERCAAVISPFKSCKVSKWKV